MTNLRQQSGFSLVEMLMVMGMASVAAVAVMQIQSAMNKGNAKSMGMMERSQFENLVSISHAIPDKCAESLATIIGQSASTSSHSLSSIKLGSNTIAVGSQTGGLVLKSAVVTIDDFSSGDTMANGSLDIKVEETIAGQKQEKSMSIPMAITVDSSNKISGCSTGSSGSDPYYICTALFAGTYDGSSCKGPTITGSDDAPVNFELDSMSSYQMEVGDYLYTMDEECEDTGSSSEDTTTTIRYNGTLISSIFNRETCSIKWYRTKLSLIAPFLTSGISTATTETTTTTTAIATPDFGATKAVVLPTVDTSTDPTEVMDSGGGTGSGGVGGSEGGLSP